MFYMMTMGEHPFGPSRDTWENNIKRGHPVNIGLLLKGAYPNYEAHDLISHMIINEYKMRPSAQQVLQHPFFWPASTKLALFRELLLYLKREKRRAGVEKEKEKDAKGVSEKEKGLPEKEKLLKLMSEERIRQSAFGRNGSWKENIHPAILPALQNFKNVKYEDHLTDLLLVIKHTQKYLADDDSFKREITQEMQNWELMEGAWVSHYFQRRFPKLLLIICHVIKSDIAACDWFRNHPDFVTVQRYFERECFNNQSAI